MTPEQLRRAHAVSPISAVQTEWSLMWREVEDDLVPTARELGIGVVAYSPLGRGLLTGALRRDTAGQADFRASDQRFSSHHAEQNLRVVDELTEVAAAVDCTVGQVGLAWLLAQGADVFAIPGSRHADRVVHNAAAHSIVLDSEMVAKIDAVAGRDRWSGDRRSFASPDVTRRR